jgi:2',3'-cyclic-nucleotide 2'-phosphodiesterase/3'-nucleotidase
MRREAGFSAQGAAASLREKAALPPRPLFAKVLKSLRPASAGLALLFPVLSLGQTTHIRVLATTDLHGNLFPYDYYSAKPAPRGLAKIATLIAQERRDNPNTLLLDCGDTIQGSPLEIFHQTDIRKGATSSDPMMLAMNALRYDAMTVGNHEFNYGLRNLEAARKTAHFPWLAANIEGASNFTPFTVKTLGGARVAIIGVITPAIPAWEKAENYAGLHFTDPVAAVKKIADEIRQKHSADVIIVTAHSGLDRDPKTSAPSAQDLPNENLAFEIAQNTQVDAVIFGHTHSELPSYQVGQVQMLQPRNWGMSLGELDLSLDKTPTGWKVSSKTSRVIPVTDQTPADESLLAIGKPYHDAAEKYLEKPVANSKVALSAAYARVEDTALIDAIQTVELAEAKAQVSFASAFDLTVTVPAGKITVRQLAALYPYDNTLYRIQGTGKMIREALENAARYFRTCPADCSQPPLINPSVIGYNFDMASGVSYDIDLHRPEGSRIVNLRFQGQPLDDGKPVEIAVNSYRAGGSAGYTMFRGAKVLWRSSEDIREMMIQFYTNKGELPAAPDLNWHVTPEEAHQELRREAQEAGHPALR